MHRGARPVMFVWLDFVVAPTVMIVPLVILVLVAVRGVSTEVRDVWSRMPEVLGREISKSLGTTVRIGSIAIRGRSVSLEGVSLGDPARPSSPEAMLRVDRASCEVPIDIRARLESDRPLVDRVRIEGAVVRLSRSARGDWNFSTLFKTKPGASGRRWIDTIAVERGRVEFSDAAMPRHSDRTGGPVRAVAAQVTGELVFDRSDMLRWSATGRLSGSPVSTFGSYDGTRSRLLVGATARGVAVPAWCLRFVPQSVNFAGGVASGRALLFVRFAGPAQSSAVAHSSLDWQVEGDIEDVTLRLPWVHDSMLLRAAHVVASGAQVEASGICRVSGNEVRVRAAVADYTRPRIDVRIAGNDLDLLRVSGQVEPLRRVRLPNGLTAKGGGSVRFVGVPDRLWVEGDVDARLSGPIVPNVLTVRSAKVRALIGGPLSSPTIRIATSNATGQVGSLDAVVRDGQGSWSNQTLVVRGSGTCAGGRFELTGRSGTGPDPIPFRAVLRARRVPVRRLVAALRQLQARSAIEKYSMDPQSVAGSADIDLGVRGNLRDAVTRLEYLVQVSDPKIDTFDADRLEVGGSMVGGLWVIDRAVLLRGRSLVAASGEVSASSQTGRISIDVDGWPITELVGLWAEKSDVRVAGRLYVRDGLIEGSLAEPHIRGTVYGRGLTIGDMESDYAVASVDGGPAGILIDGEAFRLPSAAVFSGIVRRPFGGAPAASIGCTVSDIDLAEVPGVADLAAEVTGSAGADILVQVSRGEIEAKSVRAEAARIWVGDVPLESIVADASARSLSGPWLLHHASANVGGGSIAASGIWRPEGSFAATGHITDVSITELGSAALRIGSVTGRLNGDVSVEGRSVPDGAPRLYGHASVSVRNLTLNGEALGDAKAQIAMDGSRLTSGGAGGVLAEIGADGMRASVSDASYDLDTRRLEATVRARSLDLARVRRAAERMPAALSSSSWASRVADALQPVSGPIDLEGRLTGIVDDLSVDATLTTNALSVADDLTLSADIRATFDRTRADVRSVSIESGDMICSGHGRLTYGGELRCTVTADAVPVSLLSRWAPTTSPLRGLSGTLDTVAIEAEGPQESPTVTAFAAARGIAWRSGGPATTGVPTVSLSAIRLSGATISGGRARVEDLAVAVSAPSLGPDSPGSLELHLSGSAPFSWQAPMLPPDGGVDVSVRCPPQAVGPILAGSSLQADGQIEADLKLVGPSEQVVRMLTSEDGDTSGISAGGTATLLASRLSVPGLSAYLSDVDLSLRVQDRLLWAGPTVAGGPVARVHARREANDARVRAPGELRLSGAIPLLEGAISPEPLTLTATGVRLDESPLPGMNSGRLVGELALPGVAKTASVTSMSAPIGARLVLTGSIAAPKITGEVGVRNVSLRLPSDEFVPTRARHLAVNPSFDLALHALDHVFVSTTQMSAEVRTVTGQPIHLAGSLAEPRLAGRLAVDGGSLVFPTARFEIQRGGIVDVRYPGPGIAVGAEAGMDVSVDLAAVSRLSAVSVTGVPRRYTVIVEARGPILDSGARASGLPGTGSNRLRLTYRSSPPDLALSQSGLANRITALLGGQDALQAVFGSRSDAGQVLVGKFVDFVGGAIVPGLFDRTGLAESLGMDQLSVDYSRAGAFTLRLSRDLGGPFQAEYWRRLAGASDLMGSWQAWEFRLGVRVNRGLRLTWSIDDQRTNAYLFEGVYSF